MSGKQSVTLFLPLTHIKNDHSCVQHNVISPDVTLKNVLLIDMSIPPWLWKELHTFFDHLRVYYRNTVIGALKITIIYV